MNNTVAELQRECLDNASKVSSIIRKAYVVSKKLNIEDFTQWAFSELNGYTDYENGFPEYREVNVEYRAFNPFRGWIPVMIPSNSDLSVLLKQKVIESIEQIETLVEKNEGQISFRVNSDIQQVMNEGASSDFEINGFIGKIHFIGILKTVRNIVLDWTLKLEKNGIVGNGLSFSKEEKDKAATGIVNYGTVVLGDIKNSQIIGSGSGINLSQTLTDYDVSNIENIVEIIVSNLSLIKINDSQKKIIESNISVVTQEIKTSKNKQNIISALQSIKTIFEQIVGNVIASGIVYEIQKCLP